MSQLGVALVLNLGVGRSQFQDLVVWLSGLDGVHLSSSTTLA